MGSGVAFFDLDRTLIDVNSAVLYARFEKRHGRISVRQMITALFYSTMYHFNLLDMEAAYENALSAYRGVPEAEVEANTQQFFEEEVRSRLQPGAVRAMEYHRSLGHELVILSTSSLYQARAAAEAWDMDDCIANRFPANNGRLEGTVAKPFCYGKGKVDLAEKWLEGKSVSLEESYFYTDSYSDLPMLLKVGNPRVVNPDPKLRKFSKAKKWSILDWQ